MQNRFAFVGLLVALALPLPARAQPSTADVEVARGAFARAERAFQEQRYEEALSLFRLAFTKAPSDAVRFNLAVCLERLERFAEARSEYEAAAVSPSLAVEQRASAKLRAEALAPRTAELIVSGLSHGVALSVDGSAMCTAPCRVFVEPGSRELTAALPNGPLSVRIDAVAGTAHAVGFEKPRPDLPTARPASVPERSAGAPPAALEPPKSGGGLKPGWLTVSGSIATGVGVAGIVGFGLRTRALESQYHDAPTTGTRDEGLRMRALTNVSVAAAGFGAALVALDLLVFETGEDRPLRASADGLRWSF